MPPPELATYTPITEIIDPVFENLIKSFWDNFEFSFFVTSDDFLRHLRHTDKPLSRDNTLDTGS